MGGKLKYITAILLFILFWFILAERVGFQAVIIGLVLSSFIYYMNRENIFYSFEKPFIKLKKTGVFIKYLLLLIKEIVAANFQVAKIVLSKELNISPKIVKFKTKLKGDLFKTILANSITLTPGTITVEVNDDEFTVHCLLKEYGQSVKDSNFEKILLKIEEYEG